MFESLYYVPDYRGRNVLFDLFLRIWGYPIYIRRLEARSIFRMLGDIRGKTVLDLGCGDGFLSIPMSKRNARVIGIDINAQKLTLAKERFAKVSLPIEPALVVADARRLPFKDGVFDAVESNCVIEHIPNDDAVFREVSRVIRDDGLFVATMPSEEGKSIIPLMALWIRSPRWLRKLFAPRYLVENEFGSVKEARAYLKRQVLAESQNYTRQGLYDQLAAAGFEVKDFEYLIQFFGAVVQDFVFGLRAIFLNVGTALLFPIVYPITLLDRLFISKDVVGEEFAFLAWKQKEARVPPVFDGETRTLDSP